MTTRPYVIGAVLLSSLAVSSSRAAPVQQGPKLVGTGPGFGIGAGQGSSVALSADGKTAIVGGTLDGDNSGAAWVSTRSGGVWTQQGAKLVDTGAAGAGHQGQSATSRKSAISSHPAGAE